MSSPSPFRLYLIPSDGNTKQVDCPRTIQTLAGAKQYAKQWAGDVGAAGSLMISEGTKDVACAVVKNSVIVQWI
jgi:hypothetical protein